MSTQATQRLIRGAAAAVENRVSVQVRGLPRTALPTDLQRLCAQAKLENVRSVAIDYKGFEPRGVGWVTVTSPTFVRLAAKALSGMSLSGFHIQANDSPPPVVPVRTRGVEGRREAAERGIIDGDGPGGGITGSGRNVSIAGLPGKMTPEGVKAWLKSFKLAGSTTDGKEIAKIDLPPGQFSLTSRHLVRLASVSEAHRLVRKLHQTYYLPETWGKRYPIRARVIY